LPWAIIIIGIFLGAAVNYMLPNIITGTTATDNVIKSVAPFATAAVIVTLIVLGIFGRRH
jgi:hypothetical protein